jgi:hypothetical protein
LRVADALGRPSRQPDRRDHHEKRAHKTTAR